jgi:hypothetical protein
VEFGEPEAAPHGRVDEGMERSAVFIVPMMMTLSGNQKPSSPSVPYSRLTRSFRYSSRKYSSPKIFARLPRLISSMIST